MPRLFCNQMVEAEVHQELGLPLYIVKRIVQTQSEFVKNEIESGHFNSIRLPFLGKFSCKEKEVQMMNHMKGLDETQRKQFRKDVLSGRIKFNWWENKKKE